MFAWQSAGSPACAGRRRAKLLARQPSSRAQLQRLEPLGTALASPAFFWVAVAESKLDYRCQGALLFTFDPCCGSLFQIPD